MNEIQVFNYKQNDVRAVQRDGEPWFVLKDVCQVLGISHIKDAADRLEEDEVGQAEVIDRLGRKQATTIINESGLYNVMLRSDKPEAKPFRKWITAEVLPTIRKHGAYLTPETIEAAIVNPYLSLWGNHGPKEENKTGEAGICVRATQDAAGLPVRSYFNFHLSLPFHVHLSTVTSR